MSIKKGARTYDGGYLASFVSNRPHTVTELVRDRTVICYVTELVRDHEVIRCSTVVAAVNIKDLTPA